MTRFILLLSFLASAISLHAAAQPKRLLVVGASAGARHISIPSAERMLRDLAARSNGEIILSFMSDAPDYPFSRISLPPGVAAGGFPGNAPSATAAQLDAITLAAMDLVPLAGAVTRIRTELLAASLDSAAGIEARVAALAGAELNLAMARADALGRIQASANRLSAAQVSSLGGLAVPGAAGRGGAAPAPSAGTVIREAVTRLFQQHLSADSLRNYDGVIFVSATGPLPFPDAALLPRLVSEGKAVIGLHAVMDAGHQIVDPFVEMISGGGRYASSPGGGVIARRVFRSNMDHPATRDWPDGISVVDEFHQFTRSHPTIPDANVPGLDLSRIQVLLEMDYEGRRLPLAWTRAVGRGRVFYTALGHRDDVLLPGTPSSDFGGAKLNADEVSAAYQRHVLGGIRWALGLAN